MGTYSTWEFYETFGGWPDRDEAYVPLENIDAARKAAREDPPTYKATCPGPGCWCKGCRA